MQSYRSILGLLLLVSLFYSCKTEQKEALSPEEAKAIAKEAYIYGFPIVMNYKTMYAYTLDENSSEFKGDFNELGCEARVYTPEDIAIVTPNSDTPYCMGWADIGAEPVIISVPEMEAGRFYHIQLIDMYTHNFAYIGTLSTANEAARFMLAKEDWQGEIPDGIKSVVRSETDYNMLLVRIQLFNEDDLERVRQLQSELVVEPLSELLGKESSKTPFPAVPAWKEGDQFNVNLFNYLDPLLTTLEPVEDDQQLMEDIAKINLGTGKFDLNLIDPAIQTAIEEGALAGFQEMIEFLQAHSSDPNASAKIFGTREFLKQSAAENYQLDRIDMIRATAAQAGIYGNSAQEAVYPTYYTDSQGNPLNASESNYTITFEAGELPPVKAFWSLTMYDGETQLLIDNPLDRYLLNSTMLDSFKTDTDGRITLYLQKESPGEALASNWLPAPDGPFYCVLRLYGPQPDVLSGKWTPPALIKQ